jgi:hypothetical protein
MTLDGKMLCFKGSTTTTIISGTTALTGTFRSSFNMSDDYFELILWLIFFVIPS